MSRKSKSHRRPVNRTVRSCSVRQSKQLSFEQLEARHLLATLVVNSTADGPVDFDDSAVTLREAIVAANNDAIVAPGGEAGSGADTITFDETVFTGTQTINIASQLPRITSGVTITGPGANLLTIDAGDGTDSQFGTGNGFRIFNIDDGDSSRQIEVMLSGLTLTGGDESNNGGAILNREILTLDSSTVSGNASGLGGGIFNDGEVTATNSTLSGNSSLYGGGGIYTSGTATITSSTLSGNSVSGSNGGGVFNSTAGTLTITSSTLSGNSVSYDYAYGGGIFSAGTVTITSSTLSGNSADLGSGGGIYNFGTATVTNSTLSGNSARYGGGISSYTGTATLTNNIVANSLEGGDLRGGDLLTGSFNLIGDGQNLGALANTLTDDPLLGPLADNGGPTQTHALLPGSPAINAGNDSVTQTEDQRGLTRNVNGVDIGAFELQLAEPSGDSPLVTSFTRDEGGVLDRPDLLSTISVSFDVNVIVSVDDLVIRNDTLGGSLVDTSGLTFNYDTSTRTAIWNFSDLTLDAAFYSFELTSDIVSVDGNLSLDGDGDGSPGGAFIEPIYVAIQGDANLDGQVDVLNDAFALVGNLGTNGGATFAQGDFNGDGNVDVLNDAFILVGNLGESVMPPEPESEAATSQSFVPPMLAVIDPTASVSPTAAIIEQAVEKSDDETEDEFVVAVPREVVKAASPELSGDQVRDDAFASEFGSLDSFWV